MGAPTGERNTASPPAPLEGFFGGVPAVASIVLGVVFVALLGMVDGLTTDLSLAPFAVMPVALVAWNAGTRWGLVVAALAAFSTQASELTAHGGLLPWWNAVVWFAVLAAIVWLLGALQDVARRQRQRLVREAEVSDDLRSQNELKNTLLHAVSHDLKGPLAGILGAMQTIRRAELIGLTDDQRDQLYTVIEQAGAKAARIVDDLLDLDRLRRGQLTPQRIPTDVVELAQRAAAEVPSLDGHEVRIDGDHVLAEVDAGKVERIVENLLVNAGRHTPLGSEIHVAVERVKGGVTLVVEDDGPGVPEALKEEVFEPFRQGQEARGGVGIGLSLVKRFAELHGGDARVEDRPGGGARFVVELPANVESLPTAANATATAV